MSTLTRRDRLIPWYFVLFFVVIALVDGVMVTLAVRTHTGTVIDHPYERGLAYNQVVAAESAQRARGWKSEVKFAEGKLQVRLQDAQGNPLKAQDMRVRFFRPSQQGMDFDVMLSGAESTAVTMPARGLWEARVFATIDGEPFQQAHRLVIP